MTPDDTTPKPAPELKTFGIRELLRLIVIGSVLTYFQFIAIGRWVRAPRRGWPVHASKAVVDAFFVLGPTFVKVGQLMGSSPGLFPKVLADTCLRCLDEVPPFPGSQARAVIEADLGRSVDELFFSFDDVPLSSASVAQQCRTPRGRNRARVPIGSRSRSRRKDRQSCRSRS